MTKEAIKLTLSTKAIGKNQEMVHLLEQKERLELSALNRDTAMCLDMSKAFLESVFKTILNDRIKDANLPNSFPHLYRLIKDNVRFNDNDKVNELMGRLAGSVTNVVNELRNEFGAASHGSDGYHEDPIDEECTNFIVSSVDGLAAMVYRKHKNTLVPDEVERFEYNDFDEFNDWLDEQSEVFSVLIGNDTIQYTASEVLFARDIEAYREMMVQYYNEREDK